MRKQTILVTALFLALTAVVARAQSVTGSITGSVADASGAAIAGASVRLTHVATNAERSLTADERRGL